MTENSCANTSLSETPPNQISPWPPTPPNSKKRTGSVISSVRDLQRHWERTRRNWIKKPSSAYIRISDRFDPTQHLNEIEFIPRFDCYPTHLRVRMPGTIHEIVCDGLKSEFITRKNCSRGDFSQIILAGSADVPLCEPKQSRSPDIQFLHGLDRKPRVIIEVAYTQSSKALRNLADDYIVGTDGEIKRVFGIKINPVGKPCTVLEWQPEVTPSDDPEYDAEVCVRQVSCREFRAADGSSVNADECISIRLRDFDSAAEESTTPIPFRSLFAILRRAEQIQDARKENEAHYQHRPAKRIKRVYRTPSPIDELDAQDEASFVAVEKRDEESGARNDADYEPGSDPSSQEART